MQSDSFNHTGAEPLTHDDLIRLYKDLSPHLFRYAFRLLGDAGLAEECVSETFSRFLQALQNGHGPNSHVKGYLYRIAHNWVTDHYRSHARELDLDSEWTEDPDYRPSRIAIGNQEKEQVRNALMQLTSEQRQVIMLRFFEQWQHEEIAASIGKTAEATRALQYRAISVLRRILLETDEE